MYELSRGTEYHERQRDEAVLALGLSLEDVILVGPRSFEAALNDDIQIRVVTPLDDEDIEITLIRNGAGYMGLIEFLSTLTKQRDS